MNPVALITGASRGIGAACARCFAHSGYSVAILYRSRKDLAEALVQELISDGQDAFCLQADVADRAQAFAAAEEVLRRYRRIDVLVNNAGISLIKQIQDTQYAEFERLMSVNVGGAFLCAREAVKSMIGKKSGLIVNIGSITGAEGTTKGMDYAVSKAGLMYGLTKSLAQYGSPYGIRCVCVSPGPVMTREAMAKMKTLLGRAAQPQEIIDLILFLASEKGQFINGENIMIDGGRNAMNRW